jgi:hypothetical protein
MMARLNTGDTRIADLPYGQLTQFVTRLHNAGLTGDEVMRLLDKPELLREWVDQAQRLLNQPVWGPGLYFQPTDCWNTIAPGVQMKRAKPARSCTGRVVIEVRRQHEGCTCGHAWDDPTTYSLSASYVDVAPGVQVQKCHESGISVRRQEQ